MQVPISLLEQNSNHGPWLTPSNLNQTKTNIFKQEAFKPIHTNPNPSNHSKNKKQKNQPK